MKRVETVALLTLAAFLAPACSSGGGGTTGEVKAGGDFVVLKTTPINGQRVFLNDPISIDFSSEVDLDSASLTTMSFQSLDSLGNPVSELVNGTFLIGKSTGDTTAGRQLQFVPKFATNNDFSNGGFRSDRTYLVQLVGGVAQNGTVLRDRNGKGLAAPVTFSFSTAQGTQPAQLFRNPKSGGPKRTNLEVTTATSLTDVPLNLFGAPPVEVRLHFDQALNPNDGNVPVHFDTDPLVRNIANRGRVYLEYDDPVLGPNTWIPADVDLEVNDTQGSVLALRPVGVLPNNATVRVIVEQTLEDISGESNAANFSYNPVFGEFVTNSSYAQQFNGLVENFQTTEAIDFSAVFPEGQAEVGQGFVRAGFAFEGNSTTLEYEPTANEVVLNTAFTQVVPKSGLPFTVSGGVFNFRNVTIPQGVTVLGQGPNPMVWLCSGDFRVSGTLSVRGGNGARVDTLNSANFAKAGGIGVCGGGNGGDGTPSATARDARGATGRGPLQVPGKGGGGGYIACTTGCYQGSGYNGSGGGSGGGGGTLATQGDPNYRGTLGSGGTSFQQVRGIGGAGCSGGSGSRTGSLAGGEAGPQVFVDNRQDNNFWGTGININGNLRITGELSVPVGGGGGGGGGDTSNNNTCPPNNTNFISDYSGGGGGGGGGVLIVKALGEIEITPTGKIVADGGHGGGGEQVGSCGEAGGGGGGAGGMVVLMSATRIVIHAHGSASLNRYTYGQNDYDFAVSADGGVCTTGTFGGVLVTDKYPTNGSAMLAGTTYDADPLGGLGGMGIVQLMVPPGDNTLDGTNTRLDDNIKVLRTTTSGSIIELSGAEKRSILAWRGFPNTAGVFVDDNGVPTAIGNNEGDIRPAPTLLPVPFSAKSRLRSKWIDTGASRRRPMPVEDGLPRGVLGTEVGPIYSFAGINTTTAPGYVDYVPTGQSGVIVNYPIAVQALPIRSIQTNESYLGKPAFKAILTTASAELSLANRYVQYEAELLNDFGGLLASFRILSHSSSEIYLDPSSDVLPDDATKVRIRAKFFRIATNGSEGLGPVYLPTGSTTPIPNANVRIGFAFHQDPTAATGRFPQNQQDFVHDLNDPAFLAWVQANGAPRYVQWDVTFDMAFSVNGSVPPSLSPNSPRPVLGFLRLPFRF